MVLFIYILFYFIFNAKKQAIIVSLECMLDYKYNQVKVIDAHFPDRTPNICRYTKVPLMIIPTRPQTFPTNLILLVTRYCTAVEHGISYL